MIFTFTDKGDRPINEDSLGVWENDQIKCLALADGLGGHGAGDIASNLAVTTVMELISAKTSFSAQDFGALFTEAQQRILNIQKSDASKKGMKTTLNILVAVADRAYWAHIGDSRIYHFRKRKLLERTKDHSVPQMLVNMGELKEKRIRFHEDRNRLLKALGTDIDPINFEIDNTGTDIRNGDYFLLCSDGFWELIDESKMLRAINKYKKPDEIMKHMVEIVKKNGRKKDMDNFSAILMEVE